jgi:hypothetical protein
MELEQLQQHHDALLSENNSLKGVINEERAEKQAVDGLYCENLRQMVQARKHIILLETNSKNLLMQIAHLQDQVKRLEEKVKSLETPPSQEEQAA